MPNFIKKPVKIQAIQWNENMYEVIEFSDASDVFGFPEGKDYLTIGTLEGTVRASKLDYIIKGVEGEFYPCKPEIFKKTYFTEEEYAKL